MADSTDHVLPKGERKPATAVRKSGMKQGNPQSTKRKLEVRFDLVVAAVVGCKKSKPESQDIDTDYPMIPAVAGDRGMTGMLESLCPDLLLAPTAKCFGLLPEVDSYRHAIYQGETPSTAIRVSLSEIIKLANSTSIKKSFAWPLRRRYKLAYTLARSILSYSSCWFKPNWRCNDIVLVTQTQGIGDETIKSPHITAPYGCHQNPSAIHAG
jgi:hypothetical protein